MLFEMQEAIRTLVATLDSIAAVREYNWKCLRCPYVRTTLQDSSYNYAAYKVP